MKSLQALAELAGGKPIAEKIYQVNQQTLIECLGEGYVKVVNRLLGKSWLVPGLDDVNPSVVEFCFEPEGIQKLQELKQQRVQETQASKEALEALASADAKHLTQHFRPKKPDEAVKVTLEKLHKLLGESTESTLEDRLERLYVTKYCAANLCGENEYEIVFLTKGVELSLEEMPQPPTRPGVKTCGRQFTATQEDGTRVKYDTRIGRVFNILHADSEVLADVAYGDLNQFRNTQNKRVRRRLKAELRGMMLLRGRDLPRDLYGSVCLRLGMPLPPDFWHISPERLPKHAGVE